nr:hypothetical protein [Kibdelosporangium sp. MJ126-NF4]CEL23352.1 hypothetical protein [Kibdelosporangium sp. MJ126-NF4]CTQ94514.1 hypothetical protein [Kibdelosporangium sp. MJ126-NF4]
MNDNRPSRDRRLDELARIEFTGSLGEAFGQYAAALRTVSNRWNTELELASTDVRAALGSMRGRWLGLDAAARRMKARRVARRLKRAQTLAASLTGHAEWFPKEYARQFLSSLDAAKDQARRITNTEEGQS